MCTLEVGGSNPPEIIIFATFATFVFGPLRCKIAVKSSSIRLMWHPLDILLCVSGGDSMTIERVRTWLRRPILCSVVDMFLAKLHSLPRVVLHCKNLSAYLNLSFQMSLANGIHTKAISAGSSFLHFLAFDTARPDVGLFSARKAYQSNIVTVGLTCHDRHPRRPYQ